MKNEKFIERTIILQKTLLEDADPLYSVKKDLIKQIIIQLLDELDKVPDELEIVYTSLYSLSTTEFIVIVESILDNIGLHKECYKEHWLSDNVIAYHFA